MYASESPFLCAGRYNDISVAIRTKCVQYTMHFLLNHPELQQDMIHTLQARQHDSEENVRYEVVMAIVSTGIITNYSCSIYSKRRVTTLLKITIVIKKLDRFFLDFRSKTRGVKN